MALIVQKYGGTSVGNTDRIKNVAARVAKYRAQGDSVVVVVSAMSGVTDGLIKLAKDIAPLPSEREQYRRALRLPRPLPRVWGEPVRGAEPASARPAAGRPAPARQDRARCCGRPGGASRSDGWRIYRQID